MIFFLICKSPSKKFLNVMDIALVKSLIHQVLQLLRHSYELVMATHRRHMSVKLLLCCPPSMSKRFSPNCLLILKNAAFSRKQMAMTDWNSYHGEEILGATCSKKWLLRKDLVALLELHKVSWW